MSGLFIISLDFELYWGRCDKIHLNSKFKNRLLNTSSLIPKLLSIFTESEIHATWATVGMLFNDSADKWIQNRPFQIPTFHNLDRSVYNHFDPAEVDQSSFSYYFAPDLIKLIANTIGQEIGTHTYSHFPCLEAGSTLEQFRYDLIKAKELAMEYNQHLQSMVFPRNQYSDDHLRICADEGIIVVRTNPPVWYWSPTNTENVVRKFARFSDTHNIAAEKKTYTFNSLPSRSIGYPVMLPASRLFVPWRANTPILNYLKLRRIIDEMTYAAINSSYYHLWWHPENFGDNPDECLNEMRLIANHYAMLKKKYNFQSCTMQESVHLL